MFLQETNTKTCYHRVKGFVVRTRKVRAATWGSYILFDDNNIIVSGVKKENVNQGLFLTYKKGKIIAYYKYDNGLYKGLYQVNKKGKIVMKNKGSAFLDKFYSLW